MLSDSSCKPNTSVVPKNCKELRVPSVNTRISCRVATAQTMAEPRETRKKPAELVTRGVQTLG